MTAPGGPGARRCALVAALALAAASGARAQATPRPGTETSPSTALHEAWLAEVLDLDVGKAVAKYRAVAEQAPANQPEHWLAVCRLMELHRLGIGGAPAVDFRNAPAEVQEALRAVQAPIDVAPLFQQGALVPALHPATQTVQQWARTQFASSPEERRRLKAERDRLLGFDQGRAWERFGAYEIASAELRGRHEQALAQRQLYFENWRPPALDGDPKQLLERAQQNLQTWIDDSTSPQQRRMLRGIDEELKKRATDPAAALEFITRLPIFAERLLQVPGKTGEQPAKPGAPPPAADGRQGR